MVQVAVIDDIAVAEHLSESAQKIAFAEFMFVKALVALETIAVFRLVIEPSISPTLPGAHPGVMNPAKPCVCINNTGPATTTYAADPVKINLL